MEIKIKFNVRIKLSYQLQNILKRYIKNTWALFFWQYKIWRVASEIIINCGPIVSWPYNYQHNNEYLKNLYKHHLVFIFITLNPVFIKRFTIYDAFARSFSERCWILIFLCLQVAFNSPQSPRHNWVSLKKKTRKWQLNWLQHIFNKMSMVYMYIQYVSKNPFNSQNLDVYTVWPNILCVKDYIIFIKGVLFLSIIFSLFSSSYNTRYLMKLL